jgi:hypothetical protein
MQLINEAESLAAGWDQTWQRGVTPWDTGMSWVPSYADQESTHQHICAPGHQAQVVSAAGALLMLFIRL